MTEEQITQIVQEALASFMEGFEDRLASSFTKALDTVTGELEARLVALESDQARILRHLGLDTRERDVTHEGNQL